VVVLVYEIFSFLLLRIYLVLQKDRTCLVVQIDPFYIYIYVGYPSHVKLSEEMAF
jgi:hypothetical protein